MKCIIRKCIFIFSIVNIIVFCLNRNNKKIEKQEKKDFVNRYILYYGLTTQWIKNKQEKKELTEYLKNNNIKTVAIYGMGNIEELLYEDLKKSRIKIKYMVDQNAKAYQFAIKDFPVIFPSEIPQQEAVDAIIITPIFAYYEIYKELEKFKLPSKILSLEDIIFNCY